MKDSALPLATESYRRHLDDIIRTEGLYALFDCTAEDYSVDPILSEISQNFIDVSGFVDFLQNSGAEMVLAEIARSGLLDGEAGRRVIFAPCSPLVQKALDELARAFPEGLFLDSSRCGQKIDGRTILAPDAVIPEEGDVCIILTRNTEAAASYERQFGKANCLNFLDIYPKALFATVSPEARRLVGRINARDKAILFASPRPMGTISSTIAQMQRDGYGTFWFGSEDVKADYQTGYSTPKTTDVALDDYAIGDLSDLLFVFTSMEQGIAVLHYEALFPTAWDFRRAAICYVATLALIRAVKECRPAHHRAKLGLYMYDAIKPGVKNYDCSGISGRLYKMMVSEAEALVFSSYTEDFGDFVENAIRRPLPRVHCHRYQVVPDNRRPRLTDGFHIAIISVLLEEFWEPSRMGMVPYIRDIIAQGLHIHYYAGINSHERVQEFIDTLPTGQRDFFHLHKPIHDLVALANELSQYHVGWSLFNMQIFNEMTTHLEDQFTRDAMDLFTPTTLPSVIWTAAAAGLPVVCNRAMRGVIDMLPDGMTIPLSLSELGNLKAILEGIDWRKIDSIALENLDISRQIYKLYDFLESLEVNAERPRVVGLP